jgi:hypothetical protein
MVPQPPSDRSRGLALTLGIVLGVFGGHRFYAGKVKSGILQACTLGGVGLWTLYDCLVIGAGQFTDVEGRRISRWNADIPESWEEAAAPQLAAEVDALRHEVAELSERLDFAERLLTRPREVRPGE